MDGVHSKGPEPAARSSRSLVASILQKEVGAELAQLRSDPNYAGRSEKFFLDEARARVRAKLTSREMIVLFDQLAKELDAAKRWDESSISAKPYEYESWQSQWLVSKEPRLNPPENQGCPTELVASLVLVLRM